MVVTKVSLKGLAKAGIMLLFMILILVIAQVVYAAPEEIDSNSKDITEWKMFGRYLNNTRHYPANITADKLVLKWSNYYNAQFRESASVANGILYVNCYTIFDIQDAIYQ